MACLIAAIVMTLSVLEGRSRTASLSGALRGPSASVVLLVGDRVSMTSYDFLYGVLEVTCFI